jgi:lipopolysaccharide heptosyltransferase II
MNVALFLPNWIGDAVMATPAVRAVREHFRGARVVGVMRPYVADVLAGSPWLDDAIFLDPKGPLSHRWPSAAMKLRRRRIDLAVLFPNSFRSALVARLGGCRRRIGYARSGRSLLLTDRLRPIRDERGGFKPSPILDAYNRLAEAAGCPPPSRRMELFTTPADESAADAVWWQTGLAKYPSVVCLNSGGAFGAAKDWPADHFTTLARDLAERAGRGVLMLCGPSEREAVRRVVAAAGHPAVRSVADFPLSLGLTKALVRRCDLLVTTDSGPRHFAAAFDRPVVTLFGPTHIAWTETYHPKALHLQKAVPCGPCQLRTCPLDHRCMTELSPAEVFAAATGLLRRHAVPGGRHAG